MSIYQRATIDPLGNVLLTPGRWFIDLQTDEFNRILPELVPYLEQASSQPFAGKDTLLFSGRGQVMAELSITGDVLIPNSIAQQTGHWWKLPTGTTLRQAQRRLYGDTFDAPMGFFDYLAAEHPQLLQGAIDAGETLLETGKAAANIGKGMGGIVLAVGVGLGAVYLFTNLLRGK